MTTIDWLMIFGYFGVLAMVVVATRIKPAKKGLTQGEADLAAIRQMCRV